MKYQEQLTNIRKKLALAKTADTKFKVFGASSHRYKLGEPIDEISLQEFEQEYQISLPDDYRAFLLHIANGGEKEGRNQHAAGPYYGILSLANSEDAHFSQTYGNPCLLKPDLTVEQWESLLNDNSLSAGDIDGGIMIIVDQGCTYYNGLVLNGQHKGRVVYLDIQNAPDCPPFFAFEKNFLDWYERWLDEIISGDLLQENHCWFGTTMGGDERIMLDTYQCSESLAVKKDCLIGLLYKSKLSQKTLDFIDQEINEDNDFDLQQKLLFVSTKHDYRRAKIHLLRQKNLRHVVEAINRFGRSHASDWVGYLSHHLKNIENKKDLSDCVWVLEFAKYDYGELLVPFIQHSEAEMRKEAYSLLALLCERKTSIKYISYLATGKKDENAQIRKQVSLSLRHLKSDFFEEKINPFNWFRALFFKSEVSDDY